MIAHSIILTVSADQLLSSASYLGAIVPLYVGPDQILPLASALGAAVGVLLIVWHQVVSVGRKVWRLVSRKSAATGAASDMRETTPSAKGQNPGSATD